jgi:hypothetical protein
MAEGKPDKQWAEYFKNTTSFQRIPDNPYSHAYQIISTKGRKVTAASDFSDVEDMSALLGRFDNDKMISLNQMSIMLLENFKAFAGRDADMFGELFNVLFHGWKFGIRFTANKGGMERTLQHFGDKDLQGDGFGKDMQKREERMAKAEEDRYKGMAGGMYA